MHNLYILAPLYCMLTKTRILIIFIKGIWIQMIEKTKVEKKMYRNRVHVLNVGTILEIINFVRKF